MADHRSRYPPPARIDVHPAPVMERRVAPWLTLDPRPAPGLDPHPAAVAVGCPAGFHYGRIPHRTIARIRDPLTGGVEVRIARRRPVDILGGPRLDQTTIAIRAPPIEIIFGGHIDVRHLERVLPRQGHRMPALDVGRPVTA